MKSKSFKSEFPLKIEKSQEKERNFVFYPLIRFLGVGELPYRGQWLVQKFFFIRFLERILFMISSTFYVLFVLDEIGYAALGILLSISFVAQAVLDYPTGVIGDWIGQRWSLAVSFAVFGISYAILIIANSFPDFLFVYLLSAFAGSQQSGAIGSWFDNNYKIAVGDADEERKTYRGIFGKQETFLQFLVGGTIILGGVLATLFFRRLVFMLQCIGMFLFAGICLFAVKNFPEIKRSPISLKSYFSLLGEGLRVSLGSKHMFCYMLGVCVATTAFTVWGNFILLPMYFGYTGSDAGASFMRFIMYIVIGFVIVKAGEWSKRLNPRRWIPRLHLIHSFLFFGGFAFIIFLFPLEGRLNWLIICIVAIQFLITEFLATTEGFLRQRLLVDMVPDANRNSVYSLMPTLSLLFSAPVVLVAGITITNLGISLTLIGVMVIGLIATGLLLLSLHFLPKGILKEEEIEEGT